MADAEQVKLSPCVVRVLRTAVEERVTSSESLGDILCMSPHTVDEHFKTSMQAFGVRRRAEAILSALENGLLPGVRLVLDPPHSDGLAPKTPNSGG